MNRTILSVNENPVYAFFVPLCTLMWWDVARFRVSCLYVGDVDQWLLDKAREVNTIVHTIPKPSYCSTGAASQIVRLFSHLSPGTQEGDYLLAVDSDAFPLANAFQPTGAPIDLVYPDCCDHAETPYFPIGYIGMEARLWREIMPGRGSPEDALAELYRTDPTIVAGHPGWNYDETLVTRRIKAHPAFRNANIRRRPGDPPVDRIDRSAWPAAPDCTGKIDAHLIRPGWTDENWPRLRPLLAQRLNGEHLAWADSYRQTWVSR